MSWFKDPHRLTLKKVKLPKDQISRTIKCFNYLKIKFEKYLWSLDFFMPGSFRDSAGKLFNSFRRKKKSKALHQSPVQRLCISTQSLARATSLSSLDRLEGVQDVDHEQYVEMQHDRHHRGSSCAIPSSGNSQTSLGKPPRHSKDSLSTKEGSGNTLFPYTGSVPVLEHRRS